MSEIIKKILLIKSVKNQNVLGSAIISYCKDSVDVSVDFIKSLPENFLEFNVYALLGNEIYHEKLPCHQRFNFTAKGYTINGNESLTLLNEKNEAYSYAQIGKPLYDLNGILDYAKKEINTNFTTNDTTEKISKRESYEETTYDDERIATENYYELETDYEKRNISNENNKPNGEDKTEEREEKTDFNPFANETGFSAFQNSYVKQEKIKRLEEILTTHNVERSLLSVIDCGVFVKINYDNNNEYLVGAIFKNARIERFDDISVKKFIKNNLFNVSHICYGVPAVYGQKQERLTTEYKFIPRFVFEPFGEGYYVIFKEL